MRCRNRTTTRRVAPETDGAAECAKWRPPTTRNLLSANAPTVAEVDSLDLIPWSR